jgi:hypothetical protein
MRSEAKRRASRKGRSGAPSNAALAGITHQAKASMSVCIRKSLPIKTQRLLEKMAKAALLYLRRIAANMRIAANAKLTRRNQE